jgi:aspartate/methionine/tyrosine aminotransferase
MSTRGAKSAHLAPAARALAIEPFQVMRILERAKALEAQGRDIIHMEVGEPRFPVPELLLDAARRALAAESMGYTPSAGLPALRAAIAAYYATRYGIQVDPRRVIVTPGGSGALTLALALILQPGDGVLVTEPGYPCHRHIAAVVGARVQALPLDAGGGWLPNAELLVRHWRTGTRALLVTTPGNPTGVVMGGAVLGELHGAVRDRAAALIVDETYQGIVYGAEDVTALSRADDGLFVVNSFSKYFGLTGWRLGWAVVPSGWSAVAERLAQNLYLAPPTLAQHVALAALSPAMLAEFDRRRKVLRRRRDLLLAALPDLGFGVSVVPEGAFYVFSLLPAGAGDATSFAERLLEHAGVAVTPGVDFGGPDANKMLRFAYTEDTGRLATAIARFRSVLSA